MRTYKLVQSDAESFEKAVNTASTEGWELHSFSADAGVMSAVMEKVETIGPGQSESRVW